MAASLRIPMLLAALWLVQACSDEADNPEAEIRNLIGAAVEAAEKRSADDLSAMLHKTYLDDQGYNRERLGKLLRLYFLRHKNIHLFTKIDSVELLGENRATVKLHVAMAGSVISDVDALLALSAQIYRFELQLLREQEWLLQHASWAPASAASLRE